MRNLLCRAPVTPTSFHVCLSKQNFRNSSDRALNDYDLHVFRYLGSVLNSSQNTTLFEH